MNLNKIVKLGSETRLLKKDFRITEKEKKCAKIPDRVKDILGK